MASSDETSTYRCLECGEESVGLTASWKHTDEKHPETIKTDRATPEQMAAGLEKLAKLRQAR